MCTHEKVGVVVLIAVGVVAAKGFGLF